MTERAIATPLPLAPHLDTLRNPSHTILDRSGSHLLCWCPRHMCGAIYSIGAMIWSMEAPISFAEFLLAVSHRNLLPEDSSADLQRWMDACSQPPPGVTTAPGGRC